MARSIPAAVRRLKAQVADWLTPSAIHGVRSAVGHVWRDRVLDPVVTIHLFVLQIRHGNAACARVPRLGAVHRRSVRAGSRPVRPRSFRLLCRTDKPFDKSPINIAWEVEFDRWSEPLKPKQTAISAAPGWD
jgi:hypothetical protein